MKRKRSIHHTHAAGSAQQDKEQKFALGPPDYRQKQTENENTGAFWCVRVIGLGRAACLYMYLGVLVDPRTRLSRPLFEFFPVHFPRLSTTSHVPTLHTPGCVRYLARLDWRSFNHV